MFTGAGGPSLIAADRLTLPKLLRKHGYATACFGKWHVGMTFYDGAGKPIQLRLAVENTGNLDEARDATVVGLQDGVEIYAQTIQVSDSIGNRGATNFRFGAFFPASAGEIVWMVVIDDDDIDADEATAVSRVFP